MGSFSEQVWGDLRERGHYDFGATIYSAARALWRSLESVPEDQRTDWLRQFRADLPSSPDAGLVIETLVSNVEAITDDGTLAVPPAYASVVARYRPVILFMNAFFWGMRNNRRKDTIFDDPLLAGLLADSGVVVS